MLSRSTLVNIGKDSTVVPSAAIFDLPEKVLQFGTGVLLRGLPDYFIDRANRQGVFNGRIVVIKSTDSGDSGAFDRQDGLYTVCVRGIESGEQVEEDIVNSSISRVISAKSEWASVLKCAHNPELQVIVSNTTEVGITFVKDDISSSPPISFPGKLLSFLYERYKAFGGSSESGMVIIPTELITENGKKLESIVLELAHLNGLGDAFINWLQKDNFFCNSLVDRIVPGAPGASEKAALESRLGYKDDLLIMAEAYRLWAIESASDKVMEVLSFRTVDEGVAIAPDITKFRELKLRLLNGTHTLSCGLAVLAGFPTVKEAMENSEVTGYMHRLMTENIIPAITSGSIPEAEAREFAAKVLDRFRNPSIDHNWLSISVQFSSKMKMRDVPILQAFYERKGTVPAYIALGFAAYLLFMKSEALENGTFKGEVNGSAYNIQDDRAAYLSEKWEEPEMDKLVVNVLRDESLWGADLAELPGFAGAVTEQLHSLRENGVLTTIKNLQKDKTAV